ncbi:MAG: O-antigen ligase family protein, partial [Solirubrobacterales bacterium]|nr:O-antigen ligase family protein [Solirubrobacterales bacterium]
ISGEANTLLTLQGSAAGLYMSLAVVWIWTRIAHGVPTPNWLKALVPVGLVLMGLTSQRSVLLVAVAALGAVVLLAPGPKLRLALATPALLFVAFAGAAGIQAGIGAIDAGVQGSSENLTTSSAGGGPQLATELGAITGGGGGAGSSIEEGNVSWRIAIWKELVGRVPDAPVLGVGFGRPSEFVWEGQKYDFRDGDPRSSFDVTGPHNSFVNILYRMGIPAFLAFIALLAVGAARLRSALREDGISLGDRVSVVTLGAIVVGGLVSAGFNETLTGPYFALFLWVPLGMLLLWPATRGRGSIPSGVS